MINCIQLMANHVLIWYVLSSFLHSYRLRLFCQRNWNKSLQIQMDTELIFCTTPFNMQTFHKHKRTTYWNIIWWNVDSNFFPRAGSVLDQINAVVSWVGKRIYLMFGSVYYIIFMQVKFVIHDCYYTSNLKAISCVCSNTEA